MSNLLISFHRGQVHEILKKELYDKLPEGFDLEFFNDEWTEEDKIKHFKKIDFIMGFPRAISDRERAQKYLDVAKNLKFIHFLSAGYDYFDMELANERGILVANNGGANAVAVAEHTILLVLSLYKKLCKHYNGLKKGIWFREKDHDVNLFELRNKTLGIIGLGNIGKTVAKSLEGFNLKIYYYDIVRYKRYEKMLGVEYVEMEELLKKSDIVTLHVPLDEATKNMIGKHELDLMKPTSILINTARGGIIDEQELYNVLKNNKIAGAGLDVFYRERDIVNKKHTSPVFELENVIITPHYAGHTYDTWLRRIKIGYENIINYTKGKPNFIVNEKILEKEDKIKLVEREHELPPPWKR